ncbi:MAG TPA: kelch repeat-containing protein [Acidimicrobiales bacterium]|jgi:hypothetical protein|nr:kelch repeat-containing protein [Acidimicrobiales bacterium]
MGRPAAGIGARRPEAHRPGTLGTGMIRAGAAVLAAALVTAGCSHSAHPSATGSTSTSTPGTRTARATTTTSVAAATTLAATTEPWTLPDAVSRPVVLPDGGDFVILGGLATGDTSTARVMEVDPTAGQALVVGQLGLAVHDAAGADINGRFFVFGGGSFSTVSDVQAWSGAAGGTTVGHLPTARSDLAATTSDGTSYVVGGFDGTAIRPEILATTDGITFRTIGNLAVPVRYGAVAVAGGYLWVVGGVTGTSEGSTTETDAIQRIDLQSGQTSVTGHLPQPMGHATAVVIGGQMFVLGGRSGTVPSSTIWRLSAATGTVTSAGQLPQAMSDAGAVAVGGVGYVVGGETSGPAAPLDTVVILHAR